MVKSIPGSNFWPGFLITDLNGAFEGCLGSGENSAPDDSHAKELPLRIFIHNAAEVWQTAATADRRIHHEGQGGA